jgi:hypothetical protein
MWAGKLEVKNANATAAGRRYRKPHQKNIPAASLRARAG